MLKPGTDPLIMAGHYQPGPIGPRLIAQKFDHSQGIVVVKIGAGLIGKQEPRLDQEGAGNGNPLLLAS